MEDFIKEQIEVFTSEDETKIREYCAKYYIPIPEDKEIFWAGVHKVVCRLFLTNGNKISKEQYIRSYNWLMANGYTPSILDDIGGDE